MNPFLRFQHSKALNSKTFKGMQASRGMQAIEYTLVGVLVIAGSVGGILMLQSNTAQNVHNSVMNIGEMASSSQAGQDPIKGLPVTGDTPPNGGGVIGGNLGGPRDGSGSGEIGGNLGGPRGAGGGIRPGGWNPSGDQPSGGIDPLGGPIEIGNIGDYGSDLPGGGLGGPSDNGPSDNGDDSPGQGNCLPPNPPCENHDESDWN